MPTSRSSIWFRTFLAFIFSVFCTSTANADIKVSSLEVHTVGNIDWAKIEITAHEVMIDGNCYNSCNARFSFESDFRNPNRNEIRITQGSGQTVSSDFTPDHVWPNGIKATFISSTRFVSRNNSELGRFTSDEQLFLGWLIANSEEIIQYAVSSGKLSERNANFWDRKAEAFELALRGAVVPLKDDIDLFPMYIPVGFLFAEFPTREKDAQLPPHEFIATEFINTPTELKEIIQPNLAQLGYYGGGVDGLIGPQTTSAIRSFERDAGLMVNSFLDPAEIRILWSSAAIGAVEFLSSELPSKAIEELVAPDEPIEDPIVDLEVESAKASNGAIADEVETNWTKEEALVLIGDLESFVKLNGNVFGAELVIQYDNIRLINEADQWDGGLRQSFNQFAIFAFQNSDFAVFHHTQKEARIVRKQAELASLQERLSELVEIGRAHAIENPFDNTSPELLTYLENVSPYLNSETPDDLFATIEQVVVRLTSIGVEAEAIIGAPPEYVPAALDVTVGDANVVTEINSGLKSGMNIQANSSEDDLYGYFDGIYRPEGFDTWDCKSIGMDGGGIQISGTRYFGVESICEMTNPRRVEDLEAINYEFVCSGEGESYSFNATLQRHDDGVRFLTRGNHRLLESCSNNGEPHKEFPTVYHSLDSLEKDCSSISSIDFTGDNKPDLICEYDFESGRCGSRGCDFNFYVQENSGYRRVFFGQIFAWSVYQGHEGVGIQTQVNGTLCGSFAAEECVKLVLWNGNELVVVDR